MYEFNGCFWHGCLSCYPDGRDVELPHSDRRTLQQVYERTVARRTHLELRGYTVVEMWECEWRTMKKDPEVKRVVDSLHLVQPLHQREGLFGGRTNAVQLYTQVNGTNEKIIYLHRCDLSVPVC